MGVSPEILEDLRNRSCDVYTLFFKFSVYISFAKIFQKSGILQYCLLVLPVLFSERLKSVTQSWIKEFYSHSDFLVLLQFNESASAVKKLDWTKYFLAVEKGILLKQTTFITFWLPTREEEIM